MQLANHQLSRHVSQWLLRSAGLVAAAMVLLTSGEVQAQAFGYQYEVDNEQWYYPADWYDSDAYNSMEMEQYVDEYAFGDYEGYPTTEYGFHRDYGVHDDYDQYGYHRELGYHTNDQFYDRDSDLADFGYDSDWYYTNDWYTEDSDFDAWYEDF